MIRLIGFLIAVGFVSVLSVVIGVVVQGVRRRAARNDLRDRRLAALEEQQQRWALEDLELTRKRINRDQDGYYADRARHHDNPA